MEVYYVVYLFVFLLMLKFSASVFCSCIKNFYVVKNINKIPGMKINPLVEYLLLLRNVFVARKNIISNIVILQTLCGLCHVFDKERIIKVWVTSRPSVMLFKPETVEVVLRSNSTIDKAHEYKFLHPWLGTGLLTSTGDKWRARRKLLTPSFHFRILENFMPVFNEHSQILVEKLKRLSHKEWVDIPPIITMCTLDIICETAMGIQSNAQGFSNSKYVKALFGAGEILVFRTIRPWLWFDRIFNLFPSGREFKKNVNIIHNFTRKITQEKKQQLLCERKENRLQKTGNYGNQNGFLEQRRKAFLELLLEHHMNDDTLSEEDVREEVDTFMAEGHETTANAISWALYIIGLHPEVQGKIHTELESIFGGDSERHVTSDDLKAMKYLDCVLKECMRLYPTVPFIAREIREDIQILNYKVPKGALCFIFPLMLHRDPEVYPNPEVFDPNRFLPENCTGRHPYAYIPFSAGPRNCVGQKFASMEEKTIISSILRNFTLKSLDERDKINIKPHMTLGNVEPLRLKLIPHGQ